MGCSVDKELVGWSQPDGSGQWLNVQMEINDKWCPSQVCTGTIKIYILGYIKRSVDSGQREAILSLYSALLRHHLEYCVQLWSPQYRKDMDLLEKIQKRATKMMRGLKHLSCEDRQRELSLFSLQKRRFRGDLTATFQYLKDAYMKDDENLFSKACCDRTKSSGFKLGEARFRLDIRTKFFMVRVVKLWNGLHGEVVKGPSLETLKARMDCALSNQI